MADIKMLLAAFEATWPSCSQKLTEHWIIRQGTQGSNRTSAASSIHKDAPKFIAEAEEEMRLLGQPPLFALQQTDGALDAVLAQNGYELSAPGLYYHCKIGTLTKTAPPRLTAFEVWPLLQIIENIWRDAGINEAQLDIMRRLNLPKTAILGRINDRAGGAAFVAIAENVAVLHVLEIVPEQRRNGLARHMLHKAARWAVKHGATDFAVAVDEDNEPARKLYMSLGMAEFGRYHYREKTKSDAQNDPETPPRNRT